MDPRRVYVVMGVAGSGKTAVGTALARALGVDFEEGDEYHPRENVEKMAAGIPLTDGDRSGWLHAIAVRIRKSNNAHTGLVFSCSALKRSYRDLLRMEGGHIQFVFLCGQREVIATRLAARTGHYMPLSLLDSQIATLEDPSPDEDAWVCDITEPVETIVARLVARVANDV